jgi:hypothetical protein
VLTFECLSEVAQTVDPARLQAAVWEFRQGGSGLPQQILKLLPAAQTDILSIAVALVTIAIEDLGGAAWIEGISPGLADAEARHHAAAGDSPHAT